MKKMTVAPGLVVIELVDDEPAKFNKRYNCQLFMTLWKHNSVDTAALILFKLIVPRNKHSISGIFETTAVCDTAKQTEVEINKMISDKLYQFVSQLGITDDYEIKKKLTWFLGAMRFNSEKIVFEIKENV